MCLMILSVYFLFGETEQNKKTQQGRKKLKSGKASNLDQRPSHRPDPELHKL